MAEFRAPRSDCQRMLHLRAHTFAPVTYDIPKALIWEAWLHVKANQGAAGIDAETIERFETKLGPNLYKLWNRMSSGSYFPPPVKAVPIPKKSGGVRILGIPTVGDRVAQTAVKMWLEPQLDPLFCEDSYGYRPGKSALDRASDLILL